MNKWLKIALSALLALIVLAGVGAAGYRLGLTQNPEVVKQLAELRAQRQAQRQQFAPQPQSAAPQGQGNAPQNGGRINAQPGFDPRGNFKQGFNPHARFDRRGDRGGFFPGLLPLIVLGAALWFGYKYARNSGWKLVRETAQPAPPAVEPAPVAEEKQDKA